MKNLGEDYRKYIAKPLKLANRKEIAFGWDFPIAWDKEATGGYWDLSHCAYDNGYILRIRVERRKVPASLLAFLYKEKVTNMQRQGKPLRREEKKKLKEELKEDLLQKALPEVKFLDVIWDTNKEELTLLSNSKNDREVFEKLIKQSFSDPLGMLILPVEPPLLGLTTEQYQRPEKHRDHFQGIADTTPSIFTESSI